MLVQCLSDRRMWRCFPPFPGSHSLPACSSSVTSSRQMHAFSSRSRTACGRPKCDPHSRLHCDLGALLPCRHRSSSIYAHPSSKHRSSALVCTAQQSGASQQHGPREHPQPPIQKEPEQDAAQPVSEDPLEAMLYAAQQEMGMKVVWADPDEAEEDWDDALDELEDVWMRNPAPPEWAEAMGVLPSTDCSSSSSNSSSNAGSSAQSTSRSIPTITWQQLQQQHEEEEEVVVLQIATDDTAAARHVPDRVPWAAVGQVQQVQHVTLHLAELTRDTAAAWQDKAVAVLDTGHHSCLAAAIRLSAVYHFRSVVLLQLGKNSPDEAMQ